MEQRLLVPVTGLFYSCDLVLGFGQLELTGATITTSLVNRPMIFFEAFVIPPLPEDVEIPAPRPVKEEQDLWKQWTKRWDRDFAKWLRVYKEWFPTSPTPRRFVWTIVDQGDCIAVVESTSNP